MKKSTTKRTAELKRRRAAALKGWATRRQNERREARLRAERKAARARAVQQVLARERAVRGWQTRRLAAKAKEQRTQQRRLKREAREIVEVAAAPEPTPEEATELDLIRQELAELKERNEQLQTEIERLRQEKRAETFRERVDRFRREGKDPHVHYAEVQAIATQYGMTTNEVFADLMGSPKGIGK